MARRLLEAGHDLLFYSRTPEKLAEFASRGAKVAGSIVETAAHGVVITRLGNDAALAQVAERPYGLIEILPGGAIHVVMGVHQIDAIFSLTVAHQAAGQKLVAAPVLRRPTMVTARRLGIIAAGPAGARLFSLPAPGGLGAHPGCA